LRGRILAFNGLTPPNYFSRARSDVSTLLNKNKKEADKSKTGRKDPANTKQQVLPFYAYEVS
jgi:hypothetical protein